MVSLENPVEASAQKPTHVIKKNNLFAATMLAVGNITGAGIYVLVGPATAIAKSGIIFSFFIDLVVAFFIAGSYAECVSKVPRNGGSFIFIREAFGNKALYIGWIVWLSNIAYGALCAFGVAQLVAQLFGNTSPVFLISISISGVILFTFLNLRGSTGLAAAQNPLVVALLASYVIGGIYLFLNPTGVPVFLPTSEGFFPIFAASALFFDVFIGFEDICAIADEVEKPKKTIPRVLFLCIAIAAVFFFIVLTSVVLTQDMNMVMNSEIAFLEAVKTDPIVYFIVYIGAILALLTSIGVALMAASRNLYGLALFDFIDRRWSVVNPKNQSPNRALLLSMAIMMIILFTGQVEYIAKISNVSYSFSVIFVAAAAIKLRKSKKAEPEDFKMPLSPLTHYFAIGGCFLLIGFIGLDSILVTVTWFLIGLFIYLFFSSKKRVYGTFFLIVAFFITITSIMAGILFILFGLVYYFFSIADKNSKNLTLAGLKIITTIFLLALSIILFPSSSTIAGSNEIHIALNIVSAISLISAFFDVIPLQEILNLREKKRNKSSVPIHFGIGSLVVLGTGKSRFIFNFNYFWGILQVASAGLLFVIVGILFGGMVPIGDIVLDYVIKAIIVVTGLSLLFSGILWIRSAEGLKRIGILEFEESQKPEISYNIDE